MLNTSLFFFFLHETLFNFPRALRGLFQETFDNIKINRNTNTLGSCYMG